MKALAQVAAGPDMVPLNTAVLCEDCEQISSSKGNCVGCGSAALLNLAAVLNPPAKPILTTSTRQAARRALEGHYHRAAQHRMEA
jgi:hypothetical protein